MQIIQNSELERHATEYSLGPRDVANCFNLFLGRMPTNARGGGDDSGSVPELLREIFETQEFKTGVLQPLLLREELPHGKSDGAALFPMIDWVQHRLPVGTSTRRTAGATRTWAQLLELLLGDESLVSIAPYLIEAEIDSVLRARLENEGWAKAEHSVIGAVDSVSGFEVSGWAVDLCDKSLPVVVEFYADNLFIGSVTCNEPRPDVLDHVGGDGNYGFTFKISAAHRTTFSRGRTLVAVDSISHVPIGSSAVVSSDAAQPFDVIGATRKELSELRQALDRIELRLADVSRVASMPVDAYDESEQMIGFHTMLSENLEMPFKTQVLGVEVKVEKLDLTDDNQIAEPENSTMIAATRSCSNSASRDSSERPLMEQGRTRSPRRGSSGSVTCTSGIGRCRYDATSCAGAKGPSCRRASSLRISWRKRALRNMSSATVPK